MKKLFLALFFVLFTVVLSAQSYEEVERTTSFGLIPVLSDTNERTDGYYLPSLLAANKKGYGYIDCNFTKGGLIVPFLGRSMVIAAWYENGNTRDMVDIQEIMTVLQPTGPAMPDTEHLMGLAFGANINSSFALGLNFRYLLGRHFEENSTTTTTNSYKVDTNRIELNPSMTYRKGSLFVDFGIALNFQWMTETAKGSFEYDRTTTYDGNVDFSFFGRGGFAISQYSDLVLATGFGVLPIHEKQLALVGANNEEVADIVNNTYFWNFKIASILKPQKWMRIHPSLLFSLYHVDNINEVINNPLSDEVTTTKDNIFALSLMLGMDIIPVEWFSIKAGVKKDFNLIDDRMTTEDSDITVQDTRLSENLGAYFGQSFMWKGFTFTSMLNLDFFIQCPYMISGTPMTSSWAYVATVEYQW
ncbi:MAG TPA: hypothetical protein P5044_07235 [bacterium]|nr:hypothetical protein [bacterium]